MAFTCGVPFGICLTRVTRLDDDGNVIAGSNAYVTDKALRVTVTPNVETGNSFSVRNGCGCKIASKKFPDTFNWLEFSFQDAAFEPTLVAFMLGAATITDGSDVVGWAGPGALSCDEQAPLVAFEFWSQNIVGSGLDPTWPYIHFVAPATVWQLGDNTFEEGPASPILTGFSKTNSNWGDGPYGDGPPDGEDISEYGIWATSDPLPSAACAATTVTSTS